MRRNEPIRRKCLCENVYHEFLLSWSEKRKSRAAMQAKKILFHATLSANIFSSIALERETWISQELSSPFIDWRGR